MNKKRFGKKIKKREKKRKKEDEKHARNKIMDCVISVFVGLFCCVGRYVITHKVTIFCFLSNSLA